MYAGGGLEAKTVEALGHDERLIGRKAGGYRISNRRLIVRRHIADHDRDTPAVKADMDYGHGAPAPDRYSGIIPIRSYQDS